MNVPEQGHQGCKDNGQKWYTHPSIFSAFATFEGNLEYTRQTVNAICNISFYCFSERVFTRRIVLSDRSVKSLQQQDTRLHVMVVFGNNTGRSKLAKLGHSRIIVIDRPDRDRRRNWRRRHSCRILKELRRVGKLRGSFLL